jgi:hypothetical protein
MIDLNKLMNDNYNNAKARGYNVDDLQADLKAAAGELIEATSACEDYRRDLFSCRDDHNRKERLFMLEVADVIMCMLTVAHVMGWDAEEILRICMDKNRIKIKG